MTDELFGDRDRETFDRAVDEWGVGAQVDMAIEELAETIVVLRHVDRGKADVDDVVDELADVRIMYEQLARYFGRDGVERRVVEKMDRLRERLPEPEPEPLIDERTLHASRWLRHEDAFDPFELELPPRKSAEQIAAEIDEILDDPRTALADD